MKIVNTDTVFLPGDIVELTAPCSIEVEGECECCGNDRTFEINLYEGRRFEVAHDRGYGPWVTVWFSNSQFSRQRIFIDAWCLKLVRRPVNFPDRYDAELFQIAAH